MRRLVLMFAVVALGACAEGEPAMPQEVVFTATDFAFTGPDTIRPGVTALRMENHGESPHHLILGRFADGFGLPDLMAFVDANPTGEPPFVTWQGGVGGVMPHEGDGAIHDLPEGNYVLLCFVPDANGVPHIAHGMVHEMVVTGERHDAPLPEVDLTIRMSDYAFTPMPTTAGTHTIRVMNDGPQTHEVQLVRLNEGVTLEQLLAAFAPGAAGPPPGVFIGGSGALSPGLENYWSVDLEPGNYAMICFVPDVADGLPHAMKGMARAFTVSAS